ncbi:MAG: TAT-variant-translocated molybdopterin oxidoreductase [Fimbriimonadaceae bacterium]
MDKTRPRIDWDAVREKLKSEGGPTYWRSLDEVVETAEFKTWVEDEFPDRLSIPDIDRRTVLKFMGASAALAGLAGCRNLPQTKLVPYVNDPEGRPIGVRVQYASIMPFGGYGFPVLIDTIEGRPVKIDGNPDHPWSKGGSDIFAQAEMLNLYDPDRLRNPVNEGLISTWDAFFKQWRGIFAAKKSSQGAGVAMITETVASPCLVSKMEKLMAAYPQAKWFQYEPVNSDGEMAAIGNLMPIYDFAQAGTVLSLDGDFLSGSPHHVSYAADFASRRDPALADAMCRLYAVESAPSPTGAFADHRISVKPSQVVAVARLIASACGVSVTAASIPEVSVSWVRAVADDLKSRKGAVFVGAHQSQEVHALAHEINLAIGAPVKYVARSEGRPTPKLASLKEFVAGSFDTVIVLGGNVAYSAPGNVKVADRLLGAKNSVYLGLFENETSRLCKWQLPEAHWLEAWGDNRTPDGTISIQQPVIEPLFSGKSQLEVVLGLLGDTTSAREVTRKSYSVSDAVWNDGLKRGWMNSSPRLIPSFTASRGSAVAVSGIEAIFLPDPTLFDGRYSNNGWMQELPKPLTKLTWDNAVLIGPKLAADQKLSDEDMVKVTANGVTVEAPVFVQVGHANDSVTLHFGGGRTFGGRVLQNCGFDFMKLRGDDSFCTVTIETSKGVYPLATAQVHHSMEGRDIVREGTVAALSTNPKLLPEEHEELEIETLYNYTEVLAKENPDLPQWGMTIDLNYCTGCNACVTACQSENNIATVGKAEVSRGRELHWLRIDRYYKVAKGNERHDIQTGVGEAWKFESPMHNTGSGPIRDADALEPSNVATVFQPVPCMHCELAPCEPVCPVAATTHSHEGLNQMVYNRCVGTRYCSNNCPYKVRRFNYYNYQHGQVDFGFKNNDKRKGDDQAVIGKRYGNANFRGEEDIQLLRMINNPDVTVRSRGVMEKCTYCVQRINAARIKSKKERRPIKDGEVVTACQQACPTKAITFGDTANPQSAVSKKKKEERNYSLLEHVGTKPRTTYLGRVRNPNPSLEGGK